MKRKMILGSIILIIIIALSGCSLNNKERLPAYDYELNDQDGILVTIDGIRFIAEPELKWTNQKAGEEFGSAGGNKLFLCEDDSKMNFIFIWDEEYHPMDELHYVLLHRTDIEIPQPSAEIVDKISFNDINFRTDDEIRNQHFIYDKDIIKALFDELNENMDTWAEDADSIEKYYYAATCYSEQVPGANYGLYFEQRNGELVCGNKTDGYVEVSVEILEMLAGYEIDLKWLAEYEAS